MRKLIILLMIFILSNVIIAQQKKVAYCSNASSTGFLQIFVMNEDGSDKKQLTEIPENCMKPRWSPDGKQIVFYSDKGFIYLIRDINNIPSTGPYLVWNGVNPSFMPEGDQILFNSEFEEVPSIFTIDTATTGAEPELISDGSYSNMQVLFHTENKIVYSAFNEGVKSIMVADLDDTTENYVSKVSKNDEANLEPDISSDDNKIAYASFDNNLKGTIRIFENGKESIIGKGLPSSNVPRFSPDGKKIAFAVIKDKDVSLYTMDPDGSNRKDLNVKGGNVGTFQWIDNDRIIYDAGTDTNTEIGIINIKTGDNNIIASGGFNLQPCIQK